MNPTRTSPPPSLQDELDRITQNTRALVQPERLATSERIVAELFATGIEDQVLRAGVQAPEFTLPDALTGKPVRSADLLGLGPLIVTFFRGRWCPYCVTELEAWRNLHGQVRAAGAFLVAVSPQTRKHNDFTVQQHNLPFPILSDEGAAVAAQFGLRYSVPEAHRDYYRRILVNIPFVNSGVMYKDSPPEWSWNLLLPGTFVVDEGGRIVFSEAHADFRVRPEPAEVLAAVSALSRVRP